MLIGTLAITGVGIPGLDLGFAGFYSKDAIINAAWAASGAGGLAGFGFIIAVIAAGLTSFYSWRLIFMTFHGRAKWAGAGHGHAPEAKVGPQEHGEVHAEPNESPWVMLAPLLVLSAGAILAGGLFVESFIGPERLAFWRGAIFTGPHNHVLAAGEPPAWVVWAPLTVTALGFAAAWYSYILREGMGARIAAQRGLLWSFLYHKWYFDEVYDVLFVRPARFIGDLFWKGGDKALIDGFGPDGVSAVSYRVGQIASLVQSGYVYHYAFVMLLGIAGLLSYALWAFR